MGHHCYVELCKHDDQQDWRPNEVKLYLLAFNSILGVGNARLAEDVAEEEDADEDLVGQDQPSVRLNASFGNSWGQSLLLEGEEADL